MNKPGLSISKKIHNCNFLSSDLHVGTNSTNTNSKFDYMDLKGSFVIYVSCHHASGKHVLKSGMKQQANKYGQVIIQIIICLLCKCSAWLVDWEEKCCVLTFVCQFSNKWECSEPSSLTKA